VESEGFFKTGRKPVLALKTREGHTLRLTADHRVRRVAHKTRYLLQGEWVQAGQLQPGDEIVLNNHRALGGWDGARTEAEGYLLGLLVGDGTLKSDKAIIAVWAPELKAVGNGTVAYAQTGAGGIVQVAQAAAATLAHRADFRGFQRPIKAQGQARMVSGAVRHLAHEMGMRPGHKTLTPAIEKASSAFAAGLLRGLFDADGSVQGTQEKGVSVRLSQSDLPLLQTAQRILLRLGIAATIYQNRRPAQARALPDGRGGLKLYDTKALHELVISGDNLRIYAERIGFADTAKAARLEQLLGGYSRNLNRERFTATVESLADDGEEDVFDVTVADIHAFDANGYMFTTAGSSHFRPTAAATSGR
jgi:ribonucleoside-diphosphate reductase alpha chain